MIEIDLTSKRFGDRLILGPLRLSVAAGETLSIAGPSGVGKTTLLRILAGLDTDFEGRLRGAARPAIAFQEPTLLPWRTALENMTLVTGISDVRGEALLKDVGLEGMSHLFPGQLSLGQQRRLSLARAFAADPDVLFLDEPFVSLDPGLLEDVILLTERMLAQRKIGTILVTHSTAEARRLATRQAILEGSPAQLRYVDGS